MPITLQPLSRRKFVGGSLAAGLGLMLSRRAGAAESDPHRFFLFSDTHVAADPKTLNSGINMHDNLKQAVSEALAADARAASVLINGDLPFKTGESGDYATFLELIKPLREAGMPIRLAMGNHDHRTNFWNAIQNEKDAGKKPGDVVEERYVTVVESARANWFMLDSLDKTNSTPGVVGPKQIEWLAGVLDAHKDKPAIVMVHHNPAFKNPNAAEKKEAASPPKVNGIVDTDALWSVLKERKQVKALFFGHTHNWSQAKKDDIHLINLPTVAYPFAKGKATGWVDCKLSENGATLALSCIDKKHASNGEKVELTWR